MLRHSSHNTAFIFACALLLALFFNFAEGQEVSDLKNKILGRTQEIDALEKEIAGYQIELEKVGKEGQTLQKEIKTIDLTRKKLSADIKVTIQKIAAGALTIEKLSLDIREVGNSVGVKQKVIAQSINRIRELDEQTIIEVLLSGNSLTEAWDEVASLARFEESLSASAGELKVLKVSLETTLAQREEERKKLLVLQGKITDQKKIEDQNSIRKSTILSATKNKESNYQKQLLEKTRLKEQFEQELLDLESQLRVVIDPNSLPPAGKGILRWPLDSIRITQRFGNTDFARSGAYNGKGHNGVDFGATIGTDVKTSLSGTVVGTGNTDQYPGCYSYGKWVLIKHNNGLSTLYAHLSLIKASEGQAVSTGEVIGYSGNTGYSTGPHLHLTVYATQGVEIVRLGDIKKITHCANARIPVAPLNAYLDPMDYL